VDTTSARNKGQATRSLGVGEAQLNRPGMPVEVATAYAFLASPMDPI